MVKQNKEIHFYEYPDPTALTSWSETQNAINKRLKRINTLQMGLLSGDLFEKGYRIFIHEAPYRHYEIKLGSNNERTNREIRVAHNLFKMWQAGEFSERSY